MDEEALRTIADLAAPAKPGFDPSGDRLVHVGIVENDEDVAPAKFHH